MWPRELEDFSLSGRVRVVKILRRALRAERLRGINGHWTYDLARHSQLLAAYRAECEEMKRLERTQQPISTQSASKLC
jgi:hypothetical protein